MKFIVDFHIHSHYSIATSKDLNPESLDRWARVKGIKVVGTGDFTHPGWLKELKEKLAPAEQGLFRLKDEYRQVNGLQFPASSDSEVRFLLTSEISNIYKKGDSVRKVHNVIFAPDFVTVEKIQNALGRIGNITSDGRPILGLDSRDLLEIALNSSGGIFFVPAHIWTPWFSALGDKSGFDSIEACYDDLAEHIFAVETGLSSDPPMNWMCSFLDKYTLVSNSDAHSPEKLGREANLFDTELSYDDIIRALKTGDPEHFRGTIEFFPQEGKYHYNGHRKCGICWDPVETLKHENICSVCGKKITVGVMNRVVQLSDRRDLSERKNRLPFHSVIPLKEILSEITGVGPGSKQVEKLYHTILQKAGSEFNVLLHLPVDDLRRVGGDVIAEAIRRMREGDVYIKEGFDGEYGQIRVFRENEQKKFGAQDSLFGELVREGPPEYKTRKLLNFDLEEYRRLESALMDRLSDHEKVEKRVSPKLGSHLLEGLNPEQQRAVEHFTGPALIVAGPGTGKTHVLTRRIANLIRNRSIHPENILAVTFTNKASDEMKERLRILLDDKRVTSMLHVSTFHAFGLEILKEHHQKTGRNAQFLIVDQEDKERILRGEMGCEMRRVKRFSRLITEIKQNLKSAPEIADDELTNVFQEYERILGDMNVFDLDDLIYYSVNLLKNFPEILSQYREKYRWILVDEYQDINFGQYRMIRTLMPGANSNLCVIGDPHQAIYGFRGADVRYIQVFKDDYPGAAVYTLKKSYRCSEHILRASGGVIQGKTRESGIGIREVSESQTPMPDSRVGMIQGLQEGVKIKISRHGSDKSEAEFVARTIERLMGGLRFFSIDSDITEGDENSEIGSLSDFVVLCRMNRQIQVLGKAFRDHSIPYQMIGDVPFFRQEPVRSIIDVLKLAVNPENDFLKNELIGKKNFDGTQIEELKDHLEGCESVKETITTIIDRYFSTEKSEEQISLKKLLDLADDYGEDPEQFLKFAALGTGADVYQTDIENVTLMTLHAAKGLEFECVFIVGCEDGLLPYSLFESQQSDFEEERRLLYVGMTRAKKFLYLTHAERRFLLGREYRLKRSPYLDFIETGLIELSKSEYKRMEKREDNQLGMF